MCFVRYDFFTVNALLLARFARVANVNHVVHFATDSDWNPQADLQAQDRCKL